MYSNYPANRRAGRKPAGQLITGRRCCGQGCPLPPGGRRLFAKHWPLGLSRAFEAPSLPQKSEGDALQPSRGSEVFKAWCRGLPGAVVGDGGVKGDRGRFAPVSSGLLVRLQFRKGSLKRAVPCPGLNTASAPEFASWGRRVGALRAVEAALADVVATGVWSMWHLCRGDTRKTLLAAWVQF